MRLNYYPTNTLPYIPPSVIGLYQEGGELVMSEEAMEQEENPTEQLFMMAQQALENKDAEMAFAVCEMILSMMTQAQEPMEEEGEEQNIEESEEEM